MIKAGIDYSMSSPAICIYDTSLDNVFSNFKLYNLCSKKKYQQIYDNIVISSYPVDYKSNEERFNKIANWAISILLENKVDNIVLEGYSMASKAGMTFSIGENTSVLKQLIYFHKMNFITPTPGQIKKFFSGKGNADKKLMIDCFKDKYNISIASIIKCKEYDSPENDLVDALAMSLYE